MRNGTSFGASTPAEADLAELVISAFPHMQKVRFVSSGTEATMSAIRLARAYTQRKFIVKFEGCYHGHADALLVKAGSGVATLGIPGSAGVPKSSRSSRWPCPTTTPDALEEAFKKFKGQIACVIVEPVVGNMGCVPPARGYLEAGPRELHSGRQRRSDLRRSNDRVSASRSAARRNCTRFSPTSPRWAKSSAAVCRSALTAALPTSWTSSRRSGRCIRPEHCREIHSRWRRAMPQLRYLQEHRDDLREARATELGLVAGVARGRKDLRAFP